MEVFTFSQTEFMRAFIIYISLFIAFTTPVFAQKVKLSGKVQNGSGYSVILLLKDGSSKSIELPASGAFSFSGIAKKTLKGATLHLAKDGQYWGPVVLAQQLSSQKAAVSLSGKTLTDSPKLIKLGTLKPQNTNFAKAAKTINKTLRGKFIIGTDAQGKPVGAGEQGLTLRTGSSSFKLLADSEAGEDADTDGLPDALDADDDGDLVLDAVDPDAAGQDVPYTSLNMDYRNTLNANVRSGLSDSAIDAAIGGENLFALTFFLSLPQNSTATSGHIVCSDELSYCRQNTPLAYYGGVSESSSDFRGKAWSELLNSAGYPRMELINMSGGNAIVASIQPRVGRDVFKPGDIYRAVLTNSSGTEVSSRTFTLTPYFVSIPALKNYNAGSGLVNLDYDSVDPDSGSIPGVGPGDPIVLSSDGEITMTFWRPQRQAIRSDESGYYDWGNLNYGIVIEDTQATCAGYYSNFSNDLTEDSTPFGNGDSAFANQGANLTPLKDGAADRAVDAANTLTLTVNLKQCLSRAGSNPGVYRINLTAAGESVTGGMTTATQGMYVQIP